MGGIPGKPSWCREGSWGAAGGGGFSSGPRTQPSHGMKFKHRGKMPEKRFLNGNHPQVAGPSLTCPGAGRASESHLPWRLLLRTKHAPHVTADR